MAYPFQFFTEDAAAASKWHDVFHGFAGQIEFALETGLILADTRREQTTPTLEVYIDFEGRIFRWINGTVNKLPILICPVSDRDNTALEYESSMRLLSRLAFYTGMAVPIVSSGSISIRRLPFLNQPPNTGKLRTYGTSDLDASTSKALNLAYSFYKEATNSTSIFYAFLSYWKVLHLAFQEDKVKVKAWIDTSLGKVCIDSEVADLRLRSGGNDVADYLYKSCRCAIAHTKLRDIVADPDDAGDNRRISGDMYVVQRLAKYAIRTKAGILK